MKFNAVYISFINSTGISHDLGVVSNCKYTGLSASFEKLKMIPGDTNLEKKKQSTNQWGINREIEYGSLIIILRSCANYNQLNGN